MGKSSLRVKFMGKFAKRGYACATIDLTGIGSERITMEQWYNALIDNLYRIFYSDLNQFNYKEWTNSVASFDPVSKLRKFFQEILLTKIKQKIIIFIDEIDTVLSLSFPTDDFFGLIRYFYNQRPEISEYNRLNFVLLGRAEPSSLIRNKNKTPFNIGQGIYLQGFQLYEVIRPLAKVSIAV